ncbi:MAG: PEP-CTERM sorting domain-containing protein [Spirulinaceae cyanobacterium]
MFRQSALTIFGTAVTTTAMLAAPVGAVSLQSLIDSNGTLTAAGHEFSGFFCDIVFAGDETSPESCDDIEVITLGEGIKFQADFFAGQNAFIDVLLGYTVESLDPNGMIDSIGIAFDGGFTGDGLAAVVETISDPDSDDEIVAQFSVSNSDELTDLSDPDFEPDLQGDFDFLRPVKRAEVSKDIFLTAFDGTASISMITQTYDEEVVPEPGTVSGLIALGLVGTASFWRKQRQQNKP